MSHVAAVTDKKGLAERFWSIARGRERLGGDASPIPVVRHVLAILDALDRGEGDGEVSVNTRSFLKLLRESEIEGDLSYASPEQLRGEMMDERSLVFSVGVLLFERLTGRHPFGAEGHIRRRVARIRRGELGSGVNYFPNVPAGLRSILVRAMGPFREERWPSLAELRARLEQFAEDGAPPPRLPGTCSELLEASGDSADDQPTRVVRMASQFGRELMDVVDRHETERSQRPRSRPPAIPRVARGTRPPQVPATGPIKVPRVEIEEQRIGTIEAPAGAPRVPEVAPRPAPALQPKVGPTEPTVEIDESLALASTLPMPAEQRPFAADIRAPRPKWIGPVAWVAAGALAATVLLLTLRPGGDGASSSVAAADRPAATQGDTEAPAAAPAEPSEDDGADEAIPAPTVFDPEAGAAPIADAVASCFASARSTTFRAGVLFSTSTGAASRTYFAENEQIDARERHCVSKAIEGTVAGASPERNTVVDYRIVIDGEGNAEVELLGVQ